MEETRGVHRVLVGKQLGRSRCRWEDSINSDLQEVGCGVMAQDRDSSRELVNAAMNYQFP
jgi:hypothetical protein